jgi:hypothetical protein
MPALRATPGGWYEAESSGDTRVGVVARDGCECARLVECSDRSVRPKYGRLYELSHLPESDCAAEHPVSRGDGNFTLQAAWRDESQYPISFKSGHSDGQPVRVECDDR